MKLTSLYINEYKNIQSGVIVFSENNYTALVGENGSGKSNWIEAIAAVVCHLTEDRIPPFQYRLSLDENKKILFDGTSICYFDGDTPIDKSSIDLPKRLIACYSGEDIRLWELYLRDSYVKFFGNSQMLSIDEPTCLYVNRYHWAIALITLLCSEQEEVKSFIKELWGEEITLDRIKVEATIDKDSKGYKDANAIQLLDTLKQPDLYMREIKTTNFGVVGDDIIAKCRRLYYLLYALSMPVENRSLGIKMKKAILSIDIATDTGLSLRNLSEGHKKRILILLMTRVLGDDNTVYLFDEPDAHVDVTAKKSILDMIMTAKGCTVMTTHSPLMTSMMAPDAVQTVSEGFVNTGKWSAIVQNLSDNKITTIDNFLFTFKKKVFITEGKSDILYIRQAIERLKHTNPSLKKFNDVASFCLNGAGGVEFFLDNSLLPIIDFYDKMLFLFDNDQAGRDAKKKLDAFLEKHKVYKSKISSLLYANIFHRPITYDFLVEDYFPTTCYQGKDATIPNFNITGFPKYNEIKQMSEAVNAIKKYLEDHYMDSAFDSSVYAGFVPLLNEMISKLEL